MLQRGGTSSVADTFIRSNALTRNFGALPVLRVSARDEALLRFDLSSIPPGAALTSATLKLYVNGENGEGSVRLHQVLAPWLEGGVTYASFRQRFSPNATAVFRAESRTALKNVDVTRLVTRWLGGQPNYGLLLAAGADHRGRCDHDEDEDRDPTVFVSSEAANASRRPALEVCYTVSDDHCASQPCQHGGLCVNSQSGYVCRCATGYTGASCETDINDCASNPCQNGSACTDGVNSYACACANGFTGTNCEVNVDECAPGPCQNGGVCTDAVAGYTCSCPPGYDGRNCEHLIDNCAAQPCHNGGACTNGVGGYTCACAAGFEGATCDTNVDDCVANACVNGTCVDQINGYNCSCAPDWGGARCDVDLNRCSQAPCLNGGTCTNSPGSYSCACAAGYTGTNCEVDINDCAPNPCLNGGVCVDGVNSHTCSCPAGFSGAHCESSTVFYSVAVSSLTPNSGTPPSAQAGDGVISSSPTGIHCAAGNSCSGLFARGSVVTLTASPDATSMFVGWVGCPFVAGSACILSNLSGPVALQASFRRVYLTLSVSTVGTGQGVVVSAPPGINCGYSNLACTAGFLTHANVTLFAVPLDAQHVFAGWTGCTSSSGNTCTVTLDASKSVTARFDLL